MKPLMTQENHQPKFEFRSTHCRDGRTGPVIVGSTCGIINQTHIKFITRNKEILFPHKALGNKHVSIPTSRPGRAEVSRHYAACWLVHCKSRIHLRSDLKVVCSPMTRLVWPRGGGGTRLAKHHTALQSFATHELVYWLFFSTICILFCMMLYTHRAAPF